MRYHRPLYLILGLALAGCGPETHVPAVPEPIFSDMEKPGQFNRMYTFTESEDGQIRVWTQEQGDATNLYEMRKTQDGWSDSRQIVEFPNQGMLTEPSFSPYDGYLYFASNAVLPERGRGSDPNIWRVAATETGWGEVEPLSSSINTGARELGPVMDREGRLYFTSDHSRGQGGHDIYEARFNETTQDWDVLSMPAGFNTSRADAQIGITPDGNRMFFYSYRNPKLGFVDIWTATRDDNDVWQAPVNLGEPVNTKSADLGPSVSLDGTTFYFSRDGQLMQMPLKDAMRGAGWTGTEATD